MPNAAILNERTSFNPNLKIDFGIIGRLLPVLIWFAAYLPSMSMALKAIVNEGISINTNYSGPFIKSNLLNFFGENGLILFAPFSSALIAIGVYKIVRSIGANHLIAGLGAAISLSFMVFGISPGTMISPDDALFSGFTLLCFASILKTGYGTNPKSLAIAFFFGVIACWFRPFAAWPIFTVFFAAIVFGRQYEGRPYYGLFSALCWGPGLFLVSQIAKFVNSGLNSADYSKIFTNPEIAQTPFIQSWGLNLIPLLILGILALIASSIIFLDKKTSRVGLICVLIIVSSIIGSIFYNSVIAGRYLLDNLFLSIAIAILPRFIGLFRRNPQNK